MKIFKIILKPFAVIGRWIKETAWVQPLLIVGIIFGLIFAIKPVSEWIGTVADNISNRETLYKDNKVSLTNERAYNLVMDVDGKRFADEEKYFLLFVESSCSNCKEAYPAFTKLFKDKNFNDVDYKLKTIYTDEDGETGSDATKYKDNAFFKLFFNNDEYREAITSVATNSSFYLNGKLDDNKLEEIQGGTDFYTPLLLLMDKATFDEDPSSFGIKEVMIGIAGNTPTEKAELLEDCWLGEGDFKK